LAWHPQTRDLFAAEHGPTGLPREWFRTGRDEMNVILPGENYGWPKVSGVGGGDPYVHPLVVWSPAIAPGAMAFYTGDAFAWHGDAFVAALKGQALVRVVLERAPPERTGWRAVRQEALFRNDLGRIRAVAMGPDGHLYFTTSNRDGRGNPAPGDDHLFRIVPRR
jgi:quinoprotein glucose dehydrogenase